MKINCPHCRTVYEVEAGSLGKTGRPVRCARCQTVWFAERNAPVSLIRSEPFGAAGVSKIPPGLKIVPAGAIAGAADASPGTLLAEPAPAVAEVVAAEATEIHTREPQLAGADLAPVPFAELTPAPEAPPLAAEQEGAYADAELAAHDPADLPPFTAEDAASVDEAAQTAQPVEDTSMDMPRTRKTISARDERHSSGTRRASPKRRSWRWRMAPLTAAILVLATIDAGLLVWRAEVVRMFPQTASLFRWLGVPVNLRHLTITSIHAREEQKDGVRFLTLAGAIHATGADIVDVPQLHFAVVTAKGDELYAWTARPARTRLSRGESLPFVTRVAAPPKQGQQIQIRFFRQDDLAAGLR